MSEVTDGQMQATEPEGSSQASQQAEQQHVNIADQLSKPDLVTEGAQNVQPVEEDNPHVQQERPENQLQQAETNTFQSVGQQSFTGFRATGALPSVVQQGLKQTVGQQALSAIQDAKKGPSIPFNMLIPILQAHLDRDKDMQLQTVWAKLRRNEVHKDDFLRVIRNIVGDEMLKQAAHKVFLQMQAQAHRNNQANPSQHSLFSQVSSQQIPLGGSAQLHDQKVCPPDKPSQGQKSQVSSSPQAFAPQSGTQSQNSVHYIAHDHPNQNPDAKGINAMPNQPPRMNSTISMQTRNKHQQSTQFQQTSQQIYGASNPSAQTYPRSNTGSAPLRSITPVPETQPSAQAHGMAPAMMQQNTVAWQMQQNKELKTNALPPSANTKQDSGSAGKSRSVGTGNSTAKLQGKQGGPNTPHASGAVKSNKKGSGQKKSLEAAGSTPPPPSKKQKTSATIQEQSIDQLNDVTAVSGVNLREEEEQLLSAPKEESLASLEARRIAQEEEEQLFLRKGSLVQKLVEITLKCNLTNIGSDVYNCLSMCVEERLRRFISTLIRISKQRIDTERTGHRLVITSDVGRQIFLMNQKAKEEWDKKQAEEADKNKKQTEADGSSGGAELEKEKEESRPKNVKPNKEEDDKMRTTAANVAARQAVGGSDMLSKWQLMAEQARQKREGLDVAAAASQPGRGAPASTPLSNLGKGPGNHQDATKRSNSATFGSGGMKRPTGPPFVGPERSISVKDVICVLEREPQMAKSRLIYRLYEHPRRDSIAD